MLSSGCEATRGTPPRTHFSMSLLLPLPRLLLRSLKACSATIAVLQAGLGGFRVQNRVVSQPQHDQEELRQGR